MNRLIKLSLISSLLLANISHSAYLQLKDVTRSAKIHYPKILIAKQKIIEKQHAYLKAMGSFDPEIDNYLKVTPQGGYENRYDELRLTVPVENSALRIFGQYRIGQGQWPEYFKNYLTNSNGEGLFGIELPLIKDLLIDERRGDIATKRYQVELAKFRALQTEVATMRQAGQAYWYWVLQANKLYFSKKLLQLAKIRQVALKRKTSLGDTPEIDLIENKRLILKRQENLVNDQLKVKQASLALSLFYRNDNGLPILPSSSQAPLFDLANNLPVQKNRTKQDIVDEIFSFNPALRIITKLKDIVVIEIQLAENKLLPSLAAEVTTKKQYGSKGDPLLKQTSVYGGLKFNFPLYQRDAKGSYGIAVNKLSQLKLQQSYLSQQLHVKIDKIITEQNADLKRLNIIDREVELAKKIEQAERTRFNAGDSTLFLVNQREQTTFSLQIQACEILTEFYLATLELNTLSGKL